MTGGERSAAGACRAAALPGLLYDRGRPWSEVHIRPTAFGLPFSDSLRDFRDVVVVLLRDGVASSPHFIDNGIRILDHRPHQ